MSYRFLEHTSDIIIEAANDSFSKTLEDVARGMFEEMGGKSADSGSRLELTSVGKTREDLVVNFLSDIIAECEINSFTPKDIKITHCDGNAVVATLYGEKKPPENILKAITYHDLYIKETDKCVIRVLIDI